MFRVAANKKRQRCWGFAAHGIALHDNPSAVRRNPKREAVYKPRVALAFPLRVSAHDCSLDDGTLFEALVHSCFRALTHTKKPFKESSPKLALTS